jgi:NAD-dependent deacetylase
LTASADIFVVVGTSLQVYPAAGLVQYAPYNIPKYIIDPHIPHVSGIQQLRSIEAGASQGLEELYEMLLK